jgi:transposase-like protein
VALENDRRTGAAVGFLRRLLGHAGGAPDAIVTGSRASYGAAKARPSERRAVEHRRVRATARLNNRVERSSSPRACASR